jgi:hypothetical protein
MFSQPQASPGVYGITRIRLGPTGQPFSFMRENGRPVGPLKTYGGYDPQGVALGLENGWAFGPKLRNSIFYVTALSGSAS